MSIFYCLIFFLLNWLPYLGYKAQFALLFNHSWGRREGFMPFPRELVQREMQTASFRLNNSGHSKPLRGKYVWKLSSCPYSKSLISTATPILSKRANTAWYLYYHVNYQKVVQSNLILTMGFQPEQKLNLAY